jgi:hypothetical protein
MASMRALRAVAQPWMSPIANRWLGMGSLILLMVEPSERKVGPERFSLFV